MLFGVNTPEGPWNTVLNMGPDPPQRGEGAHFLKFLMKTRSYAGPRLGHVTQAYLTSAIPYISYERVQRVYSVCSVFDAAFANY